MLLRNKKEVKVQTQIDKVLRKQRKLLKNKKFKILDITDLKEKLFSGQCENMVYSLVGLKKLCKNGTTVFIMHFFLVQELIPFLIVLLESNLLRIVTQKALSLLHRLVVSYKRIIMENMGIPIIAKLIQSDDFKIAKKSIIIILHLAKFLNGITVKQKGEFIRSILVTLEKEQFANQDLDQLIISLAFECELLGLDEITFQMVKSYCLKLIYSCSILQSIKGWRAYRLMNSDTIILSLCLLQKFMIYYTVDSRNLYLIGQIIQYPNGDDDKFYDVVKSYILGDKVTFNPSELQQFVFKFIKSTLKDSLNNKQFNADILIKKGVAEIILNQCEQWLQHRYKSFFLELLIKIVTYIVDYCDPKQLQQLIISGALRILINFMKNYKQSTKMRDQVITTLILILKKGTYQLTQSIGKEGFIENIYLTELLQIGGKFILQLIANQLLTEYHTYLDKIDNLAITQ